MHMLTIIVKSVFKDEGNMYPQAYLDGCLSYKCQNAIELIFQKELMLLKQIHQKNMIFASISFFEDIGFKYEILILKELLTDFPFGI